MPSSRRQVIPANVRLRWTSLCVAATWAALLAAMNGCGSPQRNSTDNDRVISLAEFYPLEAHSFWSYVWSNRRGDKWRGSMTVTAESNDGGLRVFTAVDSIVMPDIVEVSRGGYVWDKEGLKHLYRVSAAGDSTIFSPPRVVLPSRIEPGMVVTSQYHYQVIGQGGQAHFNADVQQQQKVVAVESVTANGRTYDDCIAIETVWSDTYSDSSTQTRRKVIWLGKGVGPVKIVSGIPPTSIKVEGDAIALLGEAR